MEMVEAWYQSHAGQKPAPQTRCCVLKRAALPEFRGKVDRLRGIDKIVGENLNILGFDVLFNVHVFELAGFKNIATFLAFNKFSVFVAGHNPHARMPAQLVHDCLFGRLVRSWRILTMTHLRIKAAFLPASSRISRILSPSCGLSSISRGATRYWHVVTRPGRTVALNLRSLGALTDLGLGLGYLF